MALRRRVRDERGAGMVEMAMVFPIILLLVLGIFEFGMAWRSSLTVSNALRSSARAASNTGEDRLADYNALTAAVSAMENIDGAEITKIVIYRSTSASGDVPAQCLTASAAANGGYASGTLPSQSAVRCNVYTASQLASLSTSSFPGTTSCQGGSIDAYWCPPSQREASQSAANGADYLGVYMEVEQDFQTGLFGDGITLKDDVVMRLEPTPV